MSETISANLTASLATTSVIAPKFALSSPPSNLLGIFLVFPTTSKTTCNLLMTIKSYIQLATTLLSTTLTKSNRAISLVSKATVVSPAFQSPHLKSIPLISFINDLNSIPGSLPSLKKVTNQPFLSTTPLDSPRRSSSFFQIVMVVKSQLLLSTLLRRIKSLFVR